MDKKVILVTGASSGLGLATANHLFDKGYIVYAGARSFKEGSTEQKSESGGIIHRTYLDVTDESSIIRLVDKIISQEGRIDVLVNCAAYLVLGSVEETGDDEYKKVVDTNLYGTIKVCRHVLPLMRKQKAGLIINFSSLMGLFGIPFQSAYTATKFAIEGISECMSMEVKKFGIKVVMIEPGDHRSCSRSYRLRAQNAEIESSPYILNYQKSIKIMEHDEENGSDPYGVAGLIHKIINKRKPKLRYTIGRFDQRLSAVLKKILPGRLFESIIMGYYKQ